MPLIRRLSVTPYTHACLQRIQLFRERLSEEVHATIVTGIVGGFEFTVPQRNLKELARTGHENVFASANGKEQSRFDSYSGQEQCIDHIPYYLAGLSRAHFSDNFSRNSCIHRLFSCAYICAFVRK